MIALIGQYKVETYASWTSRVDEDCKINLSQPLIIRNSETNLISVNFDKRLQAVLREVKYLKFMNEETIPESAAQVRFSLKAIFFFLIIFQLFERHDTLRLWVSSLDQIIRWYNKIRTTVLPVELPLIEQQMDEIDAQLKGAETDLNWSSDVLEYINKTYEMIKDMEQRLQQAKDNVTKMNAIMETWAESPLFVRKVETKVLGLLSLNDRKDRVKSRYDMITKNGEEIHQLIQQNAGFFKVKI